MDQQKRLILAIVASAAILLVSDWLMPNPKPPAPKPAAITAVTPSAPPKGQAGASPVAGALAAQPTAAPTSPRLLINAPRVAGSIRLRGALIDDVVLRDYHQTVDPKSPLVRVLEPGATRRPYSVQFGWSAAPGETLALPDANTPWTASPGSLTASHPVTLSWDNGHGLTFRIVLSVDANYMFSAAQSVDNRTGTKVALFPWSRIRRDYTPVVLGTYLLHEGLIGWLHGQLRDLTYAGAKKDAKRLDKEKGAANAGAAETFPGQNGWAGITDKYWLVALIPDPSIPSTATYRYLPEAKGGYQVDFLANAQQTIAPGARATTTARLLVGAKVVHLLTRYETHDHISNFSYAVDFGWFWFLTKPFFFALDWLNSLIGNFGLAIMVFTVALKGLFFPLANRSYRSMSRMKLLQPKIQALREQYPDDKTKQQQAMMALYKTEGVNPAAGCLPMVIQIPVFFSLYKVIYVTIEMRQAPFFGWIHDLSSVDPTNVFNLFGLLPFDPSQISPFLHLGVWPLIMGVTMWLQQRLNPPPPDPVQAKMFQFMPVIFTFMLARFPAGLVIYWTWNNLLTIGQQWLIMRRTRLSRPSLARS